MKTKSPPKQALTKEIHRYDYCLCKNSGSYNYFTVIPDGIPWRLETVVHELVDGKEDDPGYVNYALNLVVGSETLDTLLLSEEFWGIAKEDDEDEMILALLNKIVELATVETERVISRNEIILDLRTLIEDEVDFWRKFQEACSTG